MQRTFTDLEGRYEVAEQTNKKIQAMEDQVMQLEK